METIPPLRPVGECLALTFGFVVLQGLVRHDVRQFNLLVPGWSATGSSVQLVQVLSLTWRSGFFPHCAMCPGMIDLFILEP